MAISYVSSSTGVPPNSTDPVVVSRPTGAGTGDVLVALFYSYGTSTADFTPPSGWTVLSATRSGTTAVAVAVKVISEISTEAGSYSFARHGSLNARGVILCYSGASIDGAVASSPTYVSYGNSVNSSFTTTTPNSMAILYSSSTQKSYVTTPPSGMTTRRSLGQGVGVWLAENAPPGNVWDQAMATPGATGSKTVPYSAYGDLVSIWVELADASGGPPPAGRRFWSRSQIIE